MPLSRRSWQRSRHRSAVSAIWAAALRDAYGELWRQPAKALEHPDDLLRRFIDQIIAMAAETQPGLIVPAVMLTNFDGKITG